MFSTEIRTFDQIEQMVCLLEGFYHEIYQKSVAMLDVIKSSGEKVKCFNGKKNCMYAAFSLCPMEFFQRIWEMGSKKVYYPEQEMFVFDGIKGRIKQFTG